MKNKNKKKKKKSIKMKNKKEFSKLLIIQESVLIWVISLSFIVLALLCIKWDFVGELPWLTAIVAFPWTAYGVSQGFYYNKAKKENQIKLTSIFNNNNNNENEIDNNNENEIDEDSEG